MATPAKRKMGRPPKYKTEAERKRDRKELDRIRWKSRINIGKEQSRWESLREELDVKLHKEVAKVLLDV